MESDTLNPNTYTYERKPNTLDQIIWFPIVVPKKLKELKK